MADPLSITASIVGIVAPAMHVTRLLLDDLQKISDAPTSVAILKEDLLSMDMALQSLRDVTDAQWKSLGWASVDRSKAVMNTCAKSCGIFRADIQKWTRHSDEGKLSWQDRANVGFFKQKRIASMSEQLRNCKTTLNAVVSIATLHSSLRHTHLTEEVRTMVSNKEAVISNAIAGTDRQLAEVKARFEELNQGHQQEQAETKDEADERAQIGEEQKTLDASQKLLEELLKTIREEMGRKEAQKAHMPTVTFGTGNSGLQIGVSNGAISGVTFGVRST
ncbi:hypothetical protein QBC33DRAFT_548404 [Phialemonium atrogriseum]|uniref:Azaphilone pigments biosynthesis cluster protein L N-terminal domain-containing protein n=1 Tax=Phialemonium atrogriseum TaxID=1093897 RepID=A0AAJ0BTJ3_9PEZI|nr:uncharacterized protein QBC33DRAFT_548404 [Phialemonium atrogriseum]KAK1763951.1 hypothetical protein QBC33DRAFT_548404 [Phialemonium atrogriseum]